MYALLAYKLVVYFYCRPSLADQIRVGCFSQDRSAQTNVSEIIQLKEVTEVLQNLVSVGRANMLILLHIIDTCVPGCKSNYNT